MGREETCGLATRTGGVEGVEEEAAGRAHAGDESEAVEGELKRDSSARDSDVMSNRSIAFLYHVDPGQPKS